MVNAPEPLRIRPDLVPARIPNWIGGRQVSAAAGGVFTKLSPHNSAALCEVTRSRADDVATAIGAASAAQTAWADLTAVQRGDLLYEVAEGLRRRRRDMADVVAMETGMSHPAALGETDAAVAQGRFMAGEGRRFYGRTTTSAVINKTAMTIRQPLGVAGLIIAANTPIANLAWKVFPALICGNTAVLKAAEDTPASAWLFGEIAHNVGLPAGVLNVIQGYGDEAGAPLVEHSDVAVVSFTGSTAVGRHIAAVAGQRLARVSLELGGKNPLVVCDDADLDQALHWALQSAFSNAGQRCAAASRLIVFDAIYDTFRDHLVERTRQLRVGPAADDDFGPVINERHLSNILAAIQLAREEGAILLTGGKRLVDEAHADGFYMAPTILEQVGPDTGISTTELFGPVTCLYRAADFNHALRLANQSPYGLTASIHTRSVHRAGLFTRRVQSGVAVVNGGTHGSEPHMPFGGLKQSGNGSREPGTEALDVYSSLKDIYTNVDPEQL